MRGKEWEKSAKCAVVSDGASGNARTSLKKAFPDVCEEFSESCYQHKDDIYPASFDPSPC